MSRNNRFQIKIDAIIDKNLAVRKFTLEEYFKIYSIPNEDEKIFAYKYTPRRIPVDLTEIKAFVNFLSVIPLDSDGINQLPIIIDLDNIRFTDKLTYIMFETVVYHMIVNKHWRITFFGCPQAENCSNGIAISSLTKGNWGVLQIKNKNFEEYISRKNDERDRAYRYLRSEKDEVYLTRCFVASNPDEKESSRISSDIFEFLSNARVLEKVNDGFVSEIIQVILEIKDNCTEHTKFPYIYDIDIKKVRHGMKSSLSGKDYIAINVAIWDFSNVRLGDAIKQKVCKIESIKTSSLEYQKQVGKKERIYRNLIDAKNNHTSFWCNDYDEDDFYALAAFQPGITGRDAPGSTGGAGLTHVLDFLCEFSDNYRCYCLSGNTMINLNRKFLSKKENNWFSFNNLPNAVFSSSRPSDECVSKSQFFYPGTAFFLHLEFNGGTNE